ncbi:MAG TPA: type II secretion system protein [Verrucomicrobiae bacterium]|nr:type II secretion system protein [Verrucomicrobiae bacterium]
MALVCSAFTLIELLVVISILGILAALTVPAFKNFGKSSVNLSASRQMLDAVARARQLAMSQRTTVYMVFVPTNFWNGNSGSWPNSWWSGPPGPGLTPAQKTAATNLCSDQLSGYNFMAYGAMGDQPGQHAWHYLGSWQTLPDGAFIAQWKFGPSYLTNYVIDLVNGATYPVAGFQRTTGFIPFPTQDSPIATTVTNLPYLAFNYLGQLTTEELTPAPLTRDAYVPLARGSVLPAVNPNKALQFGNPDVAEMPPGNSTNISYNLVHINWLTGRAVLEYHKMGP